MTAGPFSIAGKRVSTILCFTLVLGECLGQGTTTLRFEGQPTGTRSMRLYSEAGLHFQPIPIGALFLSGGGISGYPDNGTGYLEIPDRGVEFSSTDGIALFNLVSFDAAECGDFGASTLTFVGYKPQIMGPTTTVTNAFTLDGVNDGTGPLQDFQTLYTDSAFVNAMARWRISFHESGMGGG